MNALDWWKSYKKEQRTIKERIFIEIGPTVWTIYQNICVILNFQ